MQSILSIFAMKQGVNANTNIQKFKGTMTEELQSVSSVKGKKEEAINSLKETNALAVAKCVESGDKKDSVSVNLSKHNEASSIEDTVEKPVVETRTRAHYKKRLYAAAQNAEKLLFYCKAIKSDNKEQKEHADLVLEKVGQFSDKVKSLTERTSKIKADIEKKEKSQSSSETLTKNLCKAKNPAHFKVKVAVERKPSANSVSKNFGEEKVLKNIILERKTCKQHGKANHHKDKTKSVGRTQSNQYTIENEINELRRYFKELKNSLRMDKSGIGVSVSKSCDEAANNEKIVHVISELICRTTTKIFDKMLSEDFENIRMHIDEINKSWAFESMQRLQKEKLDQNSSNVMVAKTVADQIQRIQAQIDQISRTFDLLNAQVSQQRQDIIDLNSQLREMISQTYDSKREKTDDLLPDSIDLRQSYSNPDFVISQILKSVESIAVKIKNERNFQQRGDVKNAGEKIKDNTSTCKKTDFETLQAKIVTPRKNGSNCEPQRENFFRRLKMSNASVSCPETKTLSSVKRSPVQKNSQFKRTKRNFNSRTAGVKTASLVIHSKQPQKFPASDMQTVSARCSSVSSPEKNHHYRKPSPLFLSKTNYLSDVVTKEIDKRISELIRVNKIPKLLNEIASSIEPLTLSRQCSKNSKRYQDGERNGSSIRKNIFRTPLAGRQTETGVKITDKFNNPAHQGQGSADEKPIDPSKSCRSQTKLRGSRASSQKKTMDLYSREFLTSVKKSFVKIVSNEIRKSISDLVTSKNSDEVNVTSVSSLKPIHGSESLEIINPKDYSTTFLSIKSDQPYYTRDNTFSTSKMTSQITLDCVQKFIAAVSNERNHKDNLSSINYEGSPRFMSNSERNLNKKLVSNQAEYFSQKLKMNAAPNIYGVLSGVDNLNSLLRRATTMMAEKKDDLEMGRTGNCVCRDSKSK